MVDKITKDEAAIYDRQIRLWGLDAQQRIGKATILIAGITALSNEVCKNLALAGVASITLLDHGTVTEYDLGAQFFLNEASVGKNKAEAAAASIRNLNPLVSVIVDQDNIKDKPDDYFTTYSVVCLIHSDYDIISRVNSIRRKIRKPFYAGDAFGHFGYIFCDLTEHTYILEQKTNNLDKSKEPIVTKTPTTVTYNSFKESLEKDWSMMTLKSIRRRISPVAFLILMLMKFQKVHLRVPTADDSKAIIDSKPDFFKSIGITDTTLLDDSLISDMASLYDTEMTPVAAIVGGILAQDILRTLSANGLPIRNWFYYNGLDGSGMVHYL